MKIIIMVSRTFLLLILFAVSVDADCVSGVKTCVSNYLRVISDHLEDHDELCNGMRVYVNCVFHQGCYIDNVMKQQIIDRTKPSMDKLNCLVDCSTRKSPQTKMIELPAFTMTDLINEGSSSNAIISTRPPFLMATIKRVDWESMTGTFNGQQSNAIRKELPYSSATLSSINIGLMVIASFILLLLNAIF